VTNKSSGQITSRMTNSKHPLGESGRRYALGWQDLVYNPGETRLCDLVFLILGRLCIAVEAMNLTATYHSIKAQTVVGSKTGERRLS